MHLFNKNVDLVKKSLFKPTKERCYTMYRQDRLAGLVKNSDDGTIFFQNVKINFLFFHLSLNKQEATFSPTSNRQVVKTDACQV